MGLGGRWKPVDGVKWVGGGGGKDSQMAWRSERNCRLTSRSPVGTNMDRSCQEKQNRRKQNRVDQLVRAGPNDRVLRTGISVR